MKLVIFSYNFRRDNLRLQPWRYVLEMAKRLPQHGISTTVMTDVETGDVGVPAVGSIKVSPFKTDDLREAIQDLSPDVLMWPLGARSPAFVRFFKTLDCKIVGYLPGPIPRFNDLKATLAVRLPESRVAVEWMLAKNMGWARRLSPVCKAYVTLSQSNTDELRQMGVPGDNIQCITAGCDDLEILDEKKDHAGVGSGRTVVFMGWPIKIRGIELLLKGFALAAPSAHSLRLLILARGSETPGHTALRECLKDYPFRDRVRLIEGFLPAAEVEKYVAESDFGTLPFLMVPADRPIAFLEFFAAGKPVLTTDAAGLPELVGENRGIATARNPASLAEGLVRLATEPDEQFSARRKACLDFVQTYPSWDQSTGQLAALVKRAALSNPAK